EQRRSAHALFTRIGRRTAVGCQKGAVVGIARTLALDPVGLAALVARAGRQAGRCAGGGATAT
ncbi:MAG: hypothetical protein NZQ09_16920, partial [Chloroflexus sp.]|nr:hypothetical protein [Chloroflexus sp.]